MYTKFIYACFGVVAIFLGLILYFIISIARIARLDLKKWIEAFMALSLMSSDSRWRNATEILCTSLLLIGLYIMIILSNLIEQEIKELESIRSTERKNDMTLTQIEF